MSDQSLLDWIQTVGGKHGFCEPTRPSEVISGSSSSQYSYGGNTNQSAKDGGDFGQKSRENASTDKGSGSNPMQSPDLSSGKFAKRFGVGFLCSNYNTWNDLSDVAGYAKPTSKYMQAFKGMDKSKQFLDPKSAAIVSGIQTWTQALAKELNGCGQGELVVSFQGHGAGGSIYGVDEKAISASALATLAKKAEASRVSLTYVLDACETGGAVPAFQHGAADRVEKNADGAKGAGQVCSQQNEDMAESLKLKMAHARELIQLSEAIARYGGSMIQAAEGVKKAGSNQTASQTAWNAVMALNQTVAKDVKAMQTQFLHNMDFGNDPEMGLDKIQKAFTTLLAVLGGLAPQSGVDLHKTWAGQVGVFQDAISDGANKIIVLCNKRTKDYAKSQG